MWLTPIDEQGRDQPQNVEAKRGRNSYQNSPTRISRQRSLVQDRQQYGCRNDNAVN